MAQTVNTSSSSAREASRARRRAMSTKGKAGLNVATSASGSKPKSAGDRAPSKPAYTAKSAGNAVGSSARAASRARRKAMSTRGKAGVSAQDRTRADFGSSAPAKSAPVKAESSQPKSDCGCGGKGKSSADGDRAVQSSASRGAQRAKRPGSNVSLTQSKVSPASRNATKAASMGPARAASRARRKAMSTRGKAGLSANGMSQAQTARAANPDMSSRELARTVRAQRSQRGSAGRKKTEPCGRQRVSRTANSGQASPGAAQDAPWKVGAGETAYGQIVTGTQVGRSVRTTGDEYSTCRNVTGTEYMGADIFRQFCQTEPGKSPRRVGVSPTGSGNRVTGNEVGRSNRVTGDEPGTCKRVTGSQYVSANQSEAFCGTKSETGPSKITRSETRKGKAVTGNNVGRSKRVTGDETGSGRQLTGTQYMQTGDGKAPAKVGVSQTLRGGSLTGTMVGRSARVTGDEPGSCRNVTGDDYIGQEQYSGFCSVTPKADDRKVGVSQTLKGKPVSGTMTGRSGRVTGDEPGTCKAITGTPYAGAEQYRSYCDPNDARLAEARTRPQRSTPGSVMTGIQPGIGGVMTGAARGACEPVSGTPYVGSDQFAAACPATPAQPGSPDFPQPLGETPWGQFSVKAPSQAAQNEARSHAVTGAVYERGNITGPFGMASGKVTGTEEARFGNRNAAVADVAPVPATVEEIDGRAKPRISGEGMDAGPKITGDDWERGDRITGTEGTSAVRRNPTRRGGPMNAMPAVSQAPKRNVEGPEPVSKVTGGSGNTDRGALVTYSGGARG